MTDEQRRGPDTEGAPALDAQELTTEHDAQELTGAAEQIGSSAGAMTLEELEQAAGAAGRIAGRIEARAQELKKSLLDAIAEQHPETLQTFINVTAAISDFLHSDQYQTIKQNLQIVRDYISQHEEDIKTLRTAVIGLAALAPFLQAELKAAVKEDPALQQYADCTLDELIAGGFDEHGRPKPGPLYQIIERAQRRHDEFIEAGGTIGTLMELLEAGGDLEQLEADAGIPRIIAKRLNSLDYPLDKPNSVIWNHISDNVKREQDGQMSLEIDTSKKGSDQLALVAFCLDWGELPAGVEITKELTQFDKRVYMAFANLYKKYEAFTLTQIYYAMGNTTPPNKTDLLKINESLTKMGIAHIYIDNQQEVQAIKGYEHFKYDAPLLPFERRSAYISGQFVESAIHPFREPPLMSFARQRNQITTIPQRLLESPISKTEANLRIEDYLLERIGRMRRGKGDTPHKMRFEKIYERCNIRTAKQKQRAPQKIRKYLDHYKECGWIKGYAEDPDGITVRL